MNNNAPAMAAGTPQHVKEVERTIAYLQQCHGVTHDWTSAASYPAPSPHIAHQASVLFSDSEAMQRVQEAGHPDLLHAIGGYFNRMGAECRVEEVYIAPSSHAIVDALLAMQDKDKPILIQAPCFGKFIEQCQRAGIESRLLFAEAQKDWKITPEALDEALHQHQPSIFLFTNPANPTGAVYTQEEVHALAKVLAKYPDVLVISDEIFHDVILRRDITAGSMSCESEIAGHCVTLCGVGKSFGLPSTYVSFCKAPETLVEKLSQRPRYGQWYAQQKLAAYALNQGEENAAYLDQRAAFYQENIAYIQNNLEALNTALTRCYNTGAEPIHPVIAAPEGANVYLLSFASLKGMIADGKPLSTGLDVAQFLRDHAGVAMVPAEGFCMEPEAMVLRMPLSLPPEEMKRGFEAIGAACARLRYPSQECMQAI